MPEARLGTIVDMIGKRGTAGDLDFIFQQAISPDGFPAPIKVKALEALAEAASNRNLRPAKGRRQASRFDQARPNPDRSQASRRRSSVWPASGSSNRRPSRCRSLAASPSADDALRALALDALAAIGGQVGPFPDRGPVRAGSAAGHSDPGGRIAGQDSTSTPRPSGRRRSWLSPHPRAATSRHSWPPF